MIEQHHRASIRARAKLRDMTCLSAAAMALVLSGCRHKPVRSPLPIGVLAPVDLQTLPVDENAPQIASEPEPELGPLPDVQPPAPPRRRLPAAAKESEPPQIANNDVAAALAIGAISTGGDSATHTAQQAQDLINAVFKRVSALSSQLASAQKREVREVRNFLDQAQKALRSGDAEGAHTLATKANLLMDDVEKK